MSDLQAGTRVFLTAVGCDCHPPVGTPGTVTRVSATAGCAYTEVRWDTAPALTTIVTTYNGVLGRADA